MSLEIGLSHSQKPALSSSFDEAVDRETSPQILLVELVQRHLVNLTPHPYRLIGHAMLGGMKGAAVSANPGDASTRPEGARAASRGSGDSRGFPAVLHRA